MEKNEYQELSTDIFRGIMPVNTQTSLCIQFNTWYMVSGYNNERNTLHNEGTALTFQPSTILCTASWSILLQWSREGEYWVAKIYKALKSWENN